MNNPARSRLLKHADVLTWQAKTLEKYGHPGAVKLKRQAAELRNKAYSMRITRRNNERVVIKIPSDAPYCSTFGCGRKLSLVESLAGGKCTGCMGVNPIDINKYIQQ